MSGLGVGVSGSEVGVAGFGVGVSGFGVVFLWIRVGFWFLV